MAFTHLVSCNKEIEDLIVEKNISPSQAFQLGVKKMAFSDKPAFAGETMTAETKLNKLIRVKDNLQTLLFESQEEVDKLKKIKEKES